MPRYSGGCFCGAARIEVDGDLAYKKKRFCPTCGSPVFDD